MSQKETARSAKTDLDDWDTDPDYVRDINEMDQRWGDKRTVGSINMSKLIDEVRRDHKVMREKFDHPSQRDYSDGFGGKFGVQHDRRDQSALDYDHLEKLSKHTSQEISHKIIKSTTTSSIIKSGSVSDTKKTLLEKSNEDRRYQVSRSPPIPSSSIKRDFSTSGPQFRAPNESEPHDFEKSLSSTRILKEEKTSSSSSGKPSDLPMSLKSIQDKIDAFKKQFEDLESEVAKRPELAKVIKKQTVTDRDQNVSSGYFSRNMATSPIPDRDQAKSSPRPDVPKTSIRSLSEKFETMGRDDSDSFRKKTEAKRREFFDQIKNQVRETRRDHESFDPIDLERDPSDDLEKRMREKLEGLTAPTTRRSGTLLNSSQISAPRASPQSPTSFGSCSPTRRLDGTESLLSSSSTRKPKVYTHRETTEERIVSKIVKENDRIVENETKRNVEHSSSHHGSSDDEEDRPRSIRAHDRDLKTSIQQNRVSPSEKLRSNPEPDSKGSGLMARTLYDYQASESDELTFDVDDLITNIEKIDPGWFKGTITYRDGRKQVGLFPANYVRLLNDTDEH